MKASKLLKKSVLDFFSSLRHVFIHQDERAKRAGLPIHPRLAPFFEHECVRKTAVDPSTAPHAADNRQRAGLRGLYAIADTGCLDAAHLAGAVEQAIAGGARVIQYRDKIARSDFGQRSGATLAPKGRAPGMGRAQKNDDAARRLRQAQTLARLCHEQGVTFLVNDDAALAHDAGADGLHLGRDDVSLDRARTRLGAKSIIGVSCYNELERALAAEAAGADYVAFGSFFPSRTKPHAVRADLDLLRRARAELKIPIVAIGGITPENGAELVEAGADMLAAIEGVFAQPDIRAAAQRYADLFLNS